MAHFYHGSLAGEDLDLGSFGAEERTAAVSHNELENHVSSETRHILDAAFAINPHPGPWDLSNIAWQTDLSIEWVQRWFRERATGHGPRHLSDYSEPTTFASCTLAPPGPTSVEEDVQFTSGWVDHRAESIANPGFFGSNQSVDFSVYQQPDLSNYSAGVSVPYRTETKPSEYLQDLPGPLSEVSLSIEPWHPGARSELLDQHESSSSIRQPHATLLAEGWLGRNVDGPSKAGSVPESLAPPTVSSEAIGSCRSHRRRTSIKSQGDVVTCEHCGAHFTGRYGRGNCSRHIRQQHSRRYAQPGSGCVCRICKRQFNRQDARRKHEWKKHRLHDTRPLQRRQAVTHSDVSSRTGTTDAHSDQGTLTCTHTVFEDSIVKCRYRVPDSSHRAHHYFAIARSELDDDTFDRYCEQFLAWCECVVSGLRVKQSDAQHVFARVVRELSRQLRSDTSRLPELSLTDTVWQSDVNDGEGRGNNEDTGSRQSKGKAPANKRTPAISYRSHPYVGQSNTKHSRGPILTVAERFEKPACLDLDCPVYKWYLAHSNEGRVPPCNGCMEKHMNGVRQHLLPSYSQQHLRHVQYIKRCGRCTEDIVVEAAWAAGGHEARTCESRSQPRGLSFVSWARLFLKIFPDEIRVPSPYRNDPRYLPDELVAWIQDDLRLDPPIFSPSSPIATTQHARDDSSAGPDVAHPRGDAARMSWVQDELKATVSLDILISRTSKLLQELKAAKLAGFSTAYVSQDSDSVNHVEAEYHEYMHELSQQHLDQDIDVTPDCSQTTGARDLFFVPDLQQGQASAIGSADFQLPPGNTFASTTHVAGSDFDTLPSTQDNNHGDVLFGFPSMLGSSQTSYDIGSLMAQDEGHGLLAPLQVPPSPPRRPLSFLSAEGQWDPPYDPRLDQAGPSDLPQIIAEEHDRALLEAEINQMFETSSSGSPYQYRTSPPFEPENLQREPTPDWK